jgi:hypothetical protein
MAKITKERVGSILKAALQILIENNGQLPSREVMQGDKVIRKHDLTN